MRGETGKKRKTGKAERSQGTLVEETKEQESEDGRLNSKDRCAADGIPLFLREEDGPW